MRPHDAAPQEPAHDDPASGAHAGDLFGPFEMTLAGDLDAPAMARAAVTAWMLGRVDARTLIDAQLVVGEIVANSVRRADTPDIAFVSVKVEIRGDALHVEVEDEGGNGSILRRAPDRQHGGTSGFDLVEALSSRWGVARGAGMRVWAEIGLLADAHEALDPELPASPPDAAEDRGAAAIAAQTVAESGPGRAGAAPVAGDRGATEHARRSDHRVADLRAAARHHDDAARRPRLGGAGGDPDAA
jgi:anti-sigma regulatory factor (Ser/Thr protein kinase)